MHAGARPPSRSLGRAVLWLALWLLLAALPERAPAQAPEGNGLRLERTESGWYLSTVAAFDLSPVVEDALLKGVPMVFVADARLLRSRWYWTDRAVAQVERHMRLAFQPLTRKWRLSTAAEPFGSTASGGSFSQSFDTLGEALATIQRLSRWKLAEPGDIDAEARHTLEFRFRLDLSQLPRPFQIGAVGQPDWTIGVSRELRLPAGSLR